MDRVGKYVERLKSCQPVARFLVDSLVNGLLPWRCLVCGLASDARGICTPCSWELPWNDPACVRCALPMAAAGDPVCGACISRPPVFASALAPLLFRFPVNRLMHRFKFSRDLAAGAALGEVLCAELGKREGPEADLVMPVPMHRLRLMARGLNPAYELARQVSRGARLPLATHELQRTRHTPAQSGLDAASRRKNLHGAFRWRGRDLAGMRVALVDDVMTTGSTAAECARVLMRAGARSVSAWAVARAPRP